MATMNNKFVTEEGLAAYDNALNNYLPPIKRGEGENSFEQHGSTATGDYSHAEGSSTLASKHSSHAEGLGTKATGETAHAEGDCTQASGLSSHAEGSNTLAFGVHSHAEGYSRNTITINPEELEAALENWKETPCTIAMGAGAHAEGGNTFAFGTYSHTEGEGTLSKGISSHAEGSLSQAIGNYTHAEGEKTTAIGEAAHTEGFRTHASGQGSHAEGISSAKLDSYDPETLYETWENASESELFLFASGDGAHAEGGNTLAIGAYSHAEGSLTAATAWGAHAEGCGEYDSKKILIRPTLAEGPASHAEGYSTKALGQASHAEGYSTVAEGDYSHVGGRQSHSDYTGAFVHGLSCSSSRDYQTVFGQYNVEDANAAFIIGNGDKSNSKNIFTVKTDGKVYLSWSKDDSFTGNANEQVLYFKNTTGFGGENSSQGFFKIWSQQFTGGDTGKYALTLVPSAANTMAIGSNSYPFRSIFGTNIYGKYIQYDQSCTKSDPAVLSDLRLKNSIAAFDNRHERLFDGLQGKTYKYNEGTSNRTHLGFIAQEVQTAIADAGLTEQDCAVVCTINPGEEDEFLTLRYGEFVALNTWQIQKLKSRVQELENKIALLQEKLAD